MCPEKLTAFTKRKMEQILDYIEIAKNHPETVVFFSISDTVFKDSKGVLHPVIRISVDLNEIRIKELKDSK